MDIGKAFSFVFEDEAWISKVAIGGVVSIIPVVNFAALGYMLKTAEGVARGSARPMPEWNEFGDLFMRGLYFFVISLVYQIPTIALSIVMAVVISVAAAASERSEDIASGGLALVFCMYPFIFVLAILLSLATYVAAARYVATGTLSEAFKFGEVFASLRNNLSTWLMFLVIVFLAGIAGQLGVIACFIGVIFTLFYAYVVMGHGLGQAIAKLGMMPVNSYTGESYPPYTPPSYQ